MLSQKATLAIAVCCAHAQSKKRSLTATMVQHSRVPDLASHTHNTCVPECCTANHLANACTGFTCAHRTAREATCFATELQVTPRTKRASSQLPWCVPTTNTRLAWLTCGTAMVAEAHIATARGSYQTSLLPIAIAASIQQAVRSPSSANWFCCSVPHACCTTQSTAAALLHASHSSSHLHKSK